MIYHQTTWTSGLWSVIIVMSGQPRMKYLALSRVSTMARASPSTGEYLDSALVTNLLPIKVTFHPDLQHNGCCDVHKQCFCSNQYPMPSRDQSVMRQVGMILL